MDGVTPPSQPLAREEAPSVSITTFTEQEFIARCVEQFTANPANRDIAIARTLFLVTELHTNMVGAFTALQAGGLGGIKSLLGGALFGKGK